ncbi:MAG: hypothetical protein HY682_07515, partial [Chloroflexi bacterium]|nr:hypothetical protein [Chloroflexota bacterium]
MNTAGYRWAPPRAMRGKLTALLPLVLVAGLLGGIACTAPPEAQPIAQDESATPAQIADRAPGQKPLGTSEAASAQERTVSQLPEAASPTRPTGAASPTAAPLGEFVIEDMFGRRLNERFVVLVDWDGQIANPAVKLTIKPPPNASFPVQGVLTSKQPRLYFNSASRRFADAVWRSEVGKDGPKTAITFADRSTAWTGYLSIFPDRDTADEDHALSMVFKDKAGREVLQEVKVHVIDQDRAGEPLFKVIVNSSHDKTGFFSDERVGNTAIQAANDWAY